MTSEKKGKEMIITLFSRLSPDFRVTGNTLDILVKTISAFLISMYSLDSKHCTSNRVIRVFHLKCTFTQKKNLSKIQ